MIEMPVADWNAPKPNQVTHTAIRPGPQMDAFLPERASATACSMAALIVASSVTPSRSRRRRVSSAAVSTFNASASSRLALTVFLAGNALSAGQLSL